MNWVMGVAFVCCRVVSVVSNTCEAMPGEDSISTTDLLPRWKRIKGEACRERRLEYLSVFYPF